MIGGGPSASSDLVWGDLVRRVGAVMNRRLFSVVVTGLLTLCGCAAGPQGSLSSTLDPDSAARNFVAVVNAVAPVAVAECRSRNANPGYNCDFQIVVDDRRGMQANAFQTRDEADRPVIVFTLALINDVQNRDELAFVLSHEASHHILAHLDRQDVNAKLGAQVFGELATITGSTEPDAIRAAQELGAAVGARSYSKDFELEADALGAVITAEAGYNPLLGAEFFFRIPDSGNRFLSTHPATADRVAKVREIAAGLGFY